MIFAAFAVILIAINLSLGQIATIFVVLTNLCMGLLVTLALSMILLRKERYGYLIFNAGTMVFLLIPLTVVFGFIAWILTSFGSVKNV